MVTIHKLPIKDAFIVKTGSFDDHRGSLRELYNQNKYPEDISKFFPIKQTTVVSNRKDALRGLVTAPYAKLLSCAAGAIYDVVVDLRKSSPTYLNWSAVLLTHINGKQLLVPPGCAHGYYAVEEGSMIVYSQGGTYNSNFVENRVHPLDKTMNVHWPIPAGVEPILSEKDRSNPGLETNSNILERRRRVLVLGASTTVGSVMMKSLKEHQFSLQVYGASEKPTADGVMDFDMEQAACDDSYIEEIFTVCHPHVLIITLPWDSRVPSVVKRICKINKDLNMKILFCRMPTSFTEESRKIYELGMTLLKVPGAVVLNVSNALGPADAKSHVQTAFGKSSVGLYSETFTTAIMELLQKDTSGTYSFTEPNILIKLESNNVNLCNNK